MNENLDETQVVEPSPSADPAPVSEAAPDTSSDVPARSSSGSGTIPGPPTAPPPSRPSARSAPMAAFLSFVWPGLGQWYTAHPRRAIAFAIPVAVVALLLLAQVVGGLDTLAIRLLTPAFAFTILLLVVFLGLWRLLSIGDAVQLAGGRAAWRKRSTLATVAVLGLATVLVHGYLAVTALSLYNAGQQIFEAGPPAPSASPGVSPSPTDLFNATPAATPTSADARVNVLLTGIDSSTIRSHALTDTLIVASIDPKTGSVAMVSFPRDLARFELPDGTIYRGKINSLMTYAQDHPDKFPDGPLPTLLATLGHILGIPIHYYGAVNLDGFVQMIDLVGGVDIVNERAINDPTYGGWTDNRPVGFRLSAGPHHLDGQEALAYSRSRKGAGDNDFTRARRQQEVLLALRKKIVDPTMLPRLPELITLAGKTLKTNFPTDRLSEFLKIAQDADDSKVRQVVLGPRRYATNPPLSEAGGQYILVPKMDAIAEISIELFGADSAYAAAAGSGASPTPSPSGSP